MSPPSQRTATPHRKPQHARSGALTRGGHMALADRARPQAMHGTPCSVGALLETLEGAELDAFKTMLGDSELRNGWSAAAIFKAVTAEGYQVAYQQIGKHRGGKCRCGKAAA